MEELAKRALEYASNKHRNQLFNDGSGRPYIEHCKSVYSNLFKFVPYNIEKKEVLGATALLHDVLEDTDATYGELVQLFGKEIADNVQALTKNSALPKDKQLEDSVNRILAISKEAQIVKLSDRITNITYLHPLWSYSKSMHYLKEAVYIKEKLGGSNKELSLQLDKCISLYNQAIKDKQWDE